MIEKKTIRKIVVTDSCPVCADVKKWIAEDDNLDIELINASTPSGLEFAKQHGITEVPECVIINEDGSQVKVCSKDEFKSLLNPGHEHHHE